MLISVIVPTRNRADLWSYRWLIDSLYAQLDPPDEVLVALDHCEDNTAATLRAAFARPGRRFPVKILEVLAPRPGTNPASGVPDNCLFAEAAGDTIVHLDDDCRVPPRFIRHTRMLLSSPIQCALWYQLRFVNRSGDEIDPLTVEDCRPRLLARARADFLPGHIQEIQRHQELRWGAAWAVSARAIREIGGHALEYCQHHNTDTRLGNRLARYGIRNYFASGPDATVDHLGPTWYACHKHDKAAIEASQGPRHLAPIANGGSAFWSSRWITGAYTVSLTLPIDKQ